MTIIEPGSAASGLVARIKAILLQPKTEWAVIDAEPATVGGLFKTYALPLAAIGPVCSAIGQVVFGAGALGFIVRANPLHAVVTAIVAYLLSLLGIFIVATIIDALAPNFGATKDKVKAFKVAIYSATAAWIAGVFGLIPAIGVLAILGGLYSLYLFFLGLPRLMKPPEDKATTYVVVVIVVAIIVQVVIAAAATSITAAIGFGAVSSIANRQDSLSGTVKLGGASVDLGKLQAAAKQLEETNKAREDGSATIQALAPATLQALLPASIAGYARTEVQSASGGAGGIQGSNAEGVYTKGDSRLTVSVTDMAAAGGLAGLAGAFNINSSKETSTGYEKMATINGRMTTEEYDNQAKSGEYSVLVANRFMLHAQGTAVSMDDLKAAIAAVGPDKLEGLAKG